MSVNFKESNKCQLVKDSFGVSAYRWAQVPEHTSAIPRLLRKQYGIVLGVGEFVAPALYRAYRERPATYTVSDRLFRISLLLRDSVSSVVSLTALGLLAYSTHNTGVSIAGFLAVKSVLNGIVHEEFRRKIL